jgi:hypothetical protein
VFFLSLESGEAALKNADPPFAGVLRKASTIDAFMDFLVLIFGPRPVPKPSGYFSQTHANEVLARFKEKTGKASFKEAYPEVHTIWIDSLSELSRMLLEKASVNEANWTDPETKNGFAVYQEIIDALMDVQMTIRDQQDYDVVQVALISPREVEISRGRSKDKRQLWQLQVDGRPIRNGLPGFADYVLIISKKMQNRKGEPLVADERGRPVPVLITDTTPLYEGMLPKYRMGDLGKYEPAHFGRLMEKMRNGAPRKLFIPDTIEE